MRQPPSRKANNQNQIWKKTISNEELQEGEERYYQIYLINVMVNNDQGNVHTMTICTFFLCGVKKTRTRVEHFLEKSQSERDPLLIIFFLF